MSSTISVDELKAKSKQAEALIQKLQKQIEHVKLASTPEYMAQQTKRLQTENEQLKKKVEALKKELEEAEAKNGGAKPLGSLTNKQEAKEKKPAAEKKAAAAPAAKKEEPVVGNVDVSKLDIRVGKILTCEKHPEADSLYVESIDLGEGKPRSVCSGLVKYIPLDQMQNKMVLLLCNLKGAKLRGVMSEAMVLCASTPEKVELLVPPENAAVGDRVTVAGFEGEPAPECNTKNKIFDAVAPDLKTNDSLVATYKGVPLEIKGKGVVKTSSLKNVQIK